MGEDTEVLLAFVYKKHLFYLLFVSWQALGTPCSVHGLLMALCTELFLSSLSSGTTPGSAKVMLGTKLGSGASKASALPALLTL